MLPDLISGDYFTLANIKTLIIYYGYILKTGKGKGQRERENVAIYDNGFKIY